MRGSPIRPVLRASLSAGALALVALAAMRGADAQRSPLAGLDYFVGSWQCTAPSRPAPTSWLVAYRNGGALFDIAILGTSDQGTPQHLDVQIVAKGPHGELYATGSGEQGTETDRVALVGKALVFNSLQTRDGSSIERRLRPLDDAHFVDEARYVASDGEPGQFVEVCARQSPAPPSGSPLPSASGA